MSKRLNSTDDLEQYLEQIKALERQIENIEVHRQIDLREQNHRVEPPIRERHQIELRPRNRTEVNTTSRQATIRKTTLDESRIDERGRVDETGRQSRRSMQLFEDVDLEELDGTSNLIDGRSVNMSHPYEDLPDEEYSKRVFGEPRIMRTKETLRRNDKVDDDDVRDYIRGSRPFRQQSGTSATDELVGRTRNSLYPTNKSPRLEPPTIRYNNKMPDTMNDRKPYYIKPPRFDGKGCIEAHITQFNIVANRNKWTDEEKVDFLKISLSGEASNILKDIKEDISFEELEQRLKARYGSLDQVEAYRVQLKGRRRKRGESLFDLMKDIRRLFVLAYPGPSNYLSDLTAKDAFVDALDDRELMIRVMEREPKNLEEAYKISERMELYSRRVDHTERNDSNGRQKNKIRVTAVNDANDEMSAIVENQKAMQQQINTLVQMMQQQCRQNAYAAKEQVQSGEEEKSTQKTRNSQELNKRPTYNCFQCGKEGHMKSRCPENRNNRNRFTRDSHVRGETEASNMKVEESNSAAVKKIGKTLYLEAAILGKSLHCLVDTGSEVNIVPEKYVVGIDVVNSVKTLEAANGTTIGVTGEVDLEVSIGDKHILTRFIVSDQIDEVILGVDWLQSNNCSIQFSRNLMKIGGVTVPLLKKCTKYRCNRIILQEEVVIPGESEMNVMGKMVYSNFSSTNQGIWATQTRECEPGIHVASSLVPNRSLNIPIRIMNINKEEKKLEKGIALSPTHEVVVIEKKKEELVRNSKIKVQIEDIINRVDQTVPQKHKEELRAMLNEYKDIISSDEFDLGRTSIVEHRIDTGDARSVRQTLRRTPEAYSHIIDDQLEILLKQGIIEPAQSEWSSNVVLVKKKDQTWRFCIDYRQVNQISKKDSFPLPRIDSCLDTLSNSAWFSTLDMRSGYFQVKINEQDAPKSTFITRKGAFQFKVMPQGLCNSAATFQRLMHVVMAGLNFDSCLVYLDDVIIYGPTLEVHLSRLRNVLERFRSAKLKIRADKCHMLQTEVSFLGYRVSKDGISTEQSKIKAVRDWPTPVNLRELRGFIGLCSYYRKFVQGFAGIAQPLHALTKKHAKWVWDPTCQAAFEELKEKLTSTPVMTLPQDDGTYILDTDASKHHIGAVLSVVIDGMERVVCYGSRLYAKAEMNYCITRKELLAIVYFTKLYKQYLLGRKFVIRTDHAALLWLRKTPEPIGQQSRWLEQLEAFDFSIEHRPGVKHSNADAMSRLPCPQCRMDDSETAVVNAIQKQDTSRVILDTEDTWRTTNLSKLQSEDVSIKEIYALKNTFGDQKPDWQVIQGYGDVTKTLWNMWDDLFMKDDVLYRTYRKIDGTDNYVQLLVPGKLRLKVTEMAHCGMTGGHLGIARTKEQVRHRAYWPGWSKFVKRYCESCQPCAKYRRGKPPKQGKLNPIVVGMPFEILSIDVTGPHPRSSNGHIYILTAMDQFTKFAFAMPMRNQEAETIARLLMEHVFAYFGVPMQILSDQGHNFESGLFKELCQCLGIDKIRTTSYKASTNGMLERFHKTLNAMLAKVKKDSQRNWDQMLPQVMAAYRASTHSATGFSPNFLLFGQENRAPVDLVMLNPEEIKDRELSVNEFISNKQLLLTKSYSLVRNHLKVMAERRKRTYDFGVRQTEFSTNQKVWYFYPRKYAKRSQKFQCMYTGPYVVIKRLGAVNYLIKKNDKSTAFVVHVDKLKAYSEAPDESDGVNGININESPDNECFVVSDIQSGNGLIKMAPTKGNYPCKVCGKISIGSGAHHSHQRRCVAKHTKVEVVPHGDDIHLRSENQYRVQGVTTVLPPAIVSVMEESDCVRRPENLSVNPIVYFETPDENYKRIQLESAEVVSIERKNGGGNNFPTYAVRRFIRYRYTISKFGTGRNAPHGRRRDVLDRGSGGCGIPVGRTNNLSYA